MTIAALYRNWHGIHRWHKCCSDCPSTFAKTTDTCVLVHRLRIANFLHLAPDAISSVFLHVPCLYLTMTTLFLRLLTFSLKIVLFHIPSPLFENPKRACFEPFMSGWSHEACHWRHLPLRKMSHTLSTSTILGALVLLPLLSTPLCDRYWKWSLSTCQLPKLITFTVFWNLFVTFFILTTGPRLKCPLSGNAKTQMKQSLLTEGQGVSSA